jgi:hypothetical protein
MVILNNFGDNWLNASGSGDKAMMRDILLDQIAVVCIKEPVAVRNALRRNRIPCNSKQPVILARELSNRLPRNKDLCEDITKLIVDENKDNDEKFAGSDGSIQAGSWYTNTKVQKAISDGLGALFVNQSARSQTARKAKEDLEDKVRYHEQKLNSINGFKKKNNLTWFIVLGAVGVGVWALNKYFKERGSSENYEQGGEMPSSGEGTQPDSTIITTAGGESNGEQ